MTSPAKTSLLAKLRNESRRRGLPAQLMLLFYMQERFLARVSQSPYREFLILKGGLNLYSRYESAARPTRDIDLAGRNLSQTVEGMIGAIQKIAQQGLDDGITFDTENLQGQEIIEGANYGGIRINLSTHFADAVEILQLDISFGNAITPGPVELHFPSLLGDIPHRLLGYPLETIVAEKLAAAIEIGVTNTRLKDFYDLYWILLNEDLNQHSQQRAFERTFHMRGTPSNGHKTLQSLNTLEAQQAWAAFLRQNPVQAPASFEDVLTMILTEIGSLLE